ncbi:hypothetical protein CMK12_11445 [Candidatus Poribacteria bacterium]|jgi:flagellin-like hook-associated protein FlgL|nr:hypothetical protein [Candidatus Poribacteria bacterium]MDP6597658.1 hypothetical protein [Candidatus Poribacteria bacterium]MDP6749315.1 hypothetical protein [Candidatus Poribacteria bacterium]MDP6996784.1 hypothetical protein [Candidatus Poribacteria bacterium]
MILQTSLYKSKPTLADHRTKFGIDSVTTESLLLADMDVDTLSDAQTTINSLDAATNFINDQRLNSGAVRSRLDFANSNRMWLSRTLNPHYLQPETSILLLKPVTWPTRKS